MRRSLRVRGHDSGMDDAWFELNRTWWDERVADPRRFRLLRRRPLFGRLDATSCLRGGGGRRRRRARPRPPPVPLRHRHARRGRASARASSASTSREPAIDAARELAARARASTPSSWWPTCTTRRPRSVVARSTASTPASARSAGFPTSTRGRASCDELLRPGGRLHLVEFHPVTHWCLSETDLTVKYSYFHEGPWVWDDDPDEPGSYADPDATFEHNDTVEWNHGIGAIVTALAAARAAHRVARRAARRCSCSGGRSRWSTATRTGATRRTCPQIPLSFSLIAREAGAASP